MINNAPTRNPPQSWVSDTTLSLPLSSYPRLVWPVPRIDPIRRKPSPRSPPADRHTATLSLVVLFGKVECAAHTDARGLNCCHVRIAIILFISGAAVSVTSGGGFLIWTPNIFSATPILLLLSTKHALSSVRLMLMLSALMLSAGIGQFLL